MFSTSVSPGLRPSSLICPPSTRFPLSSKSRSSGSHSSQAPVLIDHMDIGDMRSQPTLSGEGSEKLAVILMGVTGSGKSTFISLLAQQDVEVGHGLESHTTAATCYSFIDETREITLIDTPGFDDTTRPDAEIFKELAHFLVALHNSRVRLAGIVYLHRITDPRVSGTAVKNLNILQRLCGPPNFDSVALVMNMWASIDNKTARQRESELRTTFWATMLDGNSIMTPHTGTRDSALQIVRSLVEKAKTKPQLILSIQRELVIDGMTLDATAAGQYIQKEMLEAKKKHEQDVVYLKSSMEDAIREKDVNLLRALHEERSAAEAKVSAAALERQQLSVTLDQLLSQDEHQKARRLFPSDIDRQEGQLNVAMHKSDLPLALVPTAWKQNFLPFQPGDTPLGQKHLPDVQRLPPSTIDHFSTPCPPGIAISVDHHQGHLCEEEKLQISLLAAEAEGRRLKGILEDGPPRQGHHQSARVGHGGSSRQKGQGQGQGHGAMVEKAKKMVGSARTGWDYVWGSGGGTGTQQQHGSHENLSYGHN